MIYCGCLSVGLEFMVICCWGWFVCHCFWRTSGGWFVLSCSGCLLLRCVCVVLYVDVWGGCCVGCIDLLN